MARKIKYYLVAAEALPEIFIRVAEAKRMMQTGEADTVGDATKKAGISRSAFYKYRDCISPFQNMMAGRIITFQMVLKDKAGVLSSILSIFANCGANILTTGITGTLCAASKLILIVFMFFGRVGIMTIGVGFMMGDRARERVQYAETKVMIG